MVRRILRSSDKGNPAEVDQTVMKTQMSALLSIMTTSKKTSVSRNQMCDITYESTILSSESDGSDSALVQL